ncbi:MAG: NADH-quinone oxidoreductase subunit H, partial [Acidobacteriota bacterium]
AFGLKVAILLYAFMLFRWTFPRYRYDQLMDLGWKWLTPAALGNIVVTAVAYVILKNGFGMKFASATDHFVGPADVRSRLAMIAIMVLIAMPGVLGVVAFINRKTATWDIAEQRHRQIVARAQRKARIASQKA